MPVGLRDEALHRLGADARAKHLTDQLLARLAGELLEAHLLDAALGPQLGEELVDLGAGQREHHPRLFAEVAQGGVDEAHGGEIAPVEILEHEEHRLRARLGAEEILPGAAHLVAHHQRVLARRAERDALFVGEGRADDLAEELGHALLIRRGDVARHAGPQLLLAHADRLAVDDRARAAQRLPEQAEGRAGAERVTAADPDLHGLAALADGAEQLVSHA